MANVHPAGAVRVFTNERGFLTRETERQQWDRRLIVHREHSPGLSECEGHLYRIVLDNIPDGLRQTQTEKISLAKMPNDTTDEKPGASENGYNPDGHRLLPSLLAGS